jgi:hypothetical protein
MRIGEDLSSGLEIDHLKMFSAGNLIGNKDLVLIEDELVWRRDSRSKQLCISSPCYSRPVQSLLTDPFRLMLCRISVLASPLSAYTVLPFGDARRWTYRSRSTTLTREIVLLADVEAFLDPFFEVVISFFHVVEERFGFTSLDLPSGQSSGSVRGGHGSRGGDEQGS